MKITEVEPLLVDRWLLTRVYTDEGIVGVGEAGLWAHPKIVEGAVREIGMYFRGKNPLEIEHHWQTVFRNTHFGGSVLSGAISAIDIALWDIAGKLLNVPVYRLLGGKCREKIRVYAQVGGRTLDELAENASACVKQGYSAVRVTPFLPDAPKMTSTAVISSAVRQVGAVREAVGDSIDLGVEVHRRQNPGEAVALAKELEKYKIFFYEDPIPPQSIDAMAYVAAHVNVPIATGERFVNIYQFWELLKKDAARIIRPDVCLAGGISHCRKIAALAEASFVGVMPHITGSPVHTAASAQLDACIPNYVLQDYDANESRPPKSEVVKEPLRFEKGYLMLPANPGIGVELNEKALDKFPYQPREIEGIFREDGSVADW